MTFRTLCLVLLAALLSGCGEDKPPLAPAQPKNLPVTDVANVARELPNYTRFGISGLAFLSNRLFVATNIGLLEVQGREVKQFYRWYDKYNVISGPWSDEPRDGVWVHREDDGYFVRLDHNGWNRIDLPKPPKGYYTRGDFLEGFVGISDKSHFYLIGAGNVWQWSDAGGWLIEPQPSAEKFSDVVGFADFGTLQLYIVRSGACALPPCNYAAYWYDAGQWHAPLRVPISRVSQVVAVSQGAFVRGSNGELLGIDVKTVTLMDIPGPCEAITRTSDGKLLASFRGSGIFVLDKGWLKLLDDPYNASEGEHWAYLSENNGVIAFATTSVPQLKQGTDNQWYFSGTDALWVSENKKLARVKLIQ